MQADKLEYARGFKLQYENLNPFGGSPLVEEYPHGVYVVQNPPSEPLTTDEFDAVYALPYERTWHPAYDAAGGVPALAEVKFSLTSNRGCMGDCSFCALNFHQGRIIQARSHESILDEARVLCADPDFKGYIHDVGGPTANFRVPACDKQLKSGACAHKRCLSPEPCNQLRADARRLPAAVAQAARAARREEGVRAQRHPVRLRPARFRSHVHPRAGAAHHVSGQLRVAPEHISDAVLQVMGKPSRAVYDGFVDEFERACREAGKEQYLVPYLMSSHPGSTLAEAVELAEYCRDLGFNPEQVQDFYPTPSTVSTCMYYTGVDPRTMKPVYVPKSPHEKALQRALIQYRNPKNRALVREALRRAGRTDLIGYDKRCLVRPAKPARSKRGIEE